MASKIKIEPSSSEGQQFDLESRIVELCQEHPKGLNSKLLSELLPDVDNKQNADAINKLLTKGKIDLLQQGNQLFYRLKDPESAKKVKGADNEEKIVYQIVEDSGNKGIWTRDIRNKSNLSVTHVNKILKSLESKKLIKAVKSVAASKKKLFMLYNLEPDRSVTGGAWYSDQDFESEFVEILNQQCFKYLQHKTTTALQKDNNPVVQKRLASATSLEVCEFISQLGISKVQLTVEDIEAILNTLVFDGKVEQDVANSESSSSSSDYTCVKAYRSISSLFNTVGLMQIPCGFCPVIERCSPKGEISPATCVYMKEWLEF